MKYAVNEIVSEFSLVSGCLKLIYDSDDVQR